MDTVTKQPAPGSADHFLAGYEQHLRELSRADGTVETYMGILRHMDRTLPDGLIYACEDELRAWIFTSEHSQATRGLYGTVATGFYGWASDPDRDDGRLDYDPSRKLPRIPKPKRLPRPIPKGQLFDILARAEQPYRDWFTTAAYCGARCIEISALDREHITSQSVWLRGKGDKERYVPTHPLVWEMAQRLPAGPIAVDHDGSRLTRQQVSRRGNHRLQGSLGYRISMHRLRHTFGTEAYEACHDLRAVQELMGHGSSSTTEGYVQASKASMRRAVAGLPVAA
jgi:integrase/recombinase XerC